MPKSHRTQRALAVHGTCPARFATEEHSSAMFAGLVWVRRSPAEAHAEDTEGASIGIQANYPGELPDSNSAPGQRYWALVHNALKPSNRLAWTPWNQFISEKKHMDQMEKQGRRPCSSMELLTQNVLGRRSTD